MSKNSPKKTIVVLEDDTILQKLIVLELSTNNFNVFSASDGEEGLALIREKKPDLVLLDLIMPKVNGFEVLTALKADKTTENIPVIILSNLGQESDIEKGKELGALDHFKKSGTDLYKLSEMLHKILD